MEQSCGAHTIQRANVGQPITKPDRMPPRDLCAAAICAIDDRVDHDEDEVYKYLARWDDLGYVTRDQLDVMVRVMD